MLILAWNHRNSQRLIEFLARYHDLPTPVFATSEQEDMWLAASLVPFFVEALELHLLKIKSSHFIELIKVSKGAPSLISS